MPAALHPDRLRALVSPRELGRAAPARDTRRRIRYAAALLLVNACASACRAVPDPIAIDGRAVRVVNQGRTEWRDVEIWVNDHYRVTTRALAGGGMFVAPLDTFVAGFGQRFDARRQTVKKVRVKARDAQGSPVELGWGS